MEQILAYLNNYFYQFGEVGTFEITNGKIKMANESYNGQYIKIENSKMNDGVYFITSVVNNEIGIEELTNETFTGVIYSLGIPRKLIDLESRINKYIEKNPPTSYTSESFGAYSYTKGTKDGKVYTWTDAFSTELRQYRKVYDGKRHIPLYKGIQNNGAISKN